MKFQPELLENQLIVQQYDATGVVISGNLQTQSVVFGTHLPLLNWENAKDGCLTLENCEWLMGHCPSSTEVILIGTGVKQVFPTTDIQKFFADQRRSVEIMDSRAACRTYNILIAERRHVIAAILL